jgi:transcriptional regulator GlxA family with amidase domain
VNPRHVVILAFEAVQPLDVTGPAEVFSGAATLVRGAYSVQVVARERAPIPTRGNGYAIVPAARIGSCRGPIDTLIVAGGSGARAAVEDAGLVRWVRGAAGRSRRVSSVCTGAFMLAAAGLLDGRRATTHWAWCEVLAREHPQVEVDPRPIFVRDGDVWTSAGVTAGIDLALAMVEDDLGPEVAREVARQLVVFVQRPGGQAQFSSHLRSAPAAREPLRELQAWIVEHLDADLRVETLAARVAMSPRNFARTFRSETGFTPAVYVESLRVEAARHRLERGSEPVELIARRAGFGTPETMRRAFARRVGTPPAQYRARFRRVAGGGQMQIAVRLYDRFTALDIIGPYDVLNSMPGAEPVFVAEKPGPVRNESGTLALVADRALAEVEQPDVVVVPGGLGSRRLLHHEPLLSWLRGVHAASAWTTSVCTGSLLLAAAGLLDGAPATTHWLVRDTLASLGARPVAQRVVRHGKIITAAGVSAGIDMALGLVALIHGDAVAKAVQLSIEYDPQPPFDAGAADKAPPEVVEMVTSMTQASG